MGEEKQNEVVKADDEKFEDLVSLWEFIEKFQKTFAVIGVFIVLGLFWKNAHPNEPTPYLSFLCFLITIPLFLEVWKDYEQNKSSWNLIAFFYIFAGIVCLSVVELIFSFPNHLTTLIAGLCWIVCMLFFGFLLDKTFNFFKNRAYKKALKKVEDLDKKMLPQNTRNEMVLLINEGAKIDYKFFERISKLAFIGAIILSLIIQYYVNTTLQAVFDKRLYSIEKIEIPPVKDN